MTGKQRLWITVGLLGAWTFLTAQAVAFINAERIQAGEIKAEFVESKVLKGTEEISGPQVIVQEASVETKLTAANIEAANATIPRLNVPDTLTAKAINAQQLNVPALLTQSVGDARNAVQAGFFGQLRAGSISTDSVTLTAGGNPVATWSAGGLNLNAPITVTGGAGSFVLDANAGTLTMKNAGGVELVKVTMQGDQSVFEMHAPTNLPQEKAVLTVKNDTQPTLILGNAMYPPLVPWGIEPIEGMINEEHNIRYWVYADFEYKTTSYWRLKYKITFENLADTGYRLGLKMMFFDHKDLAWEQTYPIPNVNLARNEKITVSGPLDVDPRLADLTRRIDVYFDSVTRQR